MSSSEGAAATLSEQSLQEGKLQQTLIQLQDQVRANPADTRLRVFLFQLLCVLGQWERALTQLQVLAGLDANSMMLARVFQPVIQCQVFRDEVFAGKRTPIIFGDPMEWIGWLTQANHLLADGKTEAAAELKSKAFEAAPVTSGKLNDQPFEWIADGDQRLGPLLEVILEGHYYWVPFCRIKRVFMEPPADLRDMVWMPAQFVWANGGEAAGHIPTRYVQTEGSDQDVLRLARKTEWQEVAPDFVVGLGQRLLATDQNDYPLLECRTIDLVTA
jgi:type VI secretion system protein ImpE